MNTSNNINVVILYGKLSEHPQEDELDVLDEVKTIKNSLLELGYLPIEVIFDLNLPHVIKQLQNINPKFVFNLVETIENKGELHPIAPALLEFLNIPFTGATSSNLMITTNKMLSKKILLAHNLPAPKGFNVNQTDQLLPNCKYILKPLKEDGSLGIDENSIFTPQDSEKISQIKKLSTSSFFIEEFIEGREFNISVLGGANPEVLPPAEIKFVDYPVEKPNIIGFTAKWHTDSFEYKNTVRTFEFSDNDNLLLKSIKKLSLECWQAFNSKGYIRIDYRIDANNNPYIIDINSNPCIAPDGGFCAATRMAGYDFNQVVSKIIEEAFIQ